MDRGFVNKGYSISLFLGSAEGGTPWCDEAIYMIHNEAMNASHATHVLSWMKLHVFIQIMYIYPKYRYWHHSIKIQMREREQIATLFIRVEKT